MIAHPTSNYLCSFVYKSLLIKCNCQSIECEVKTKIKSIRAQYIREKKKSTKLKTGTGANEVYVSKWPHLEQLKFLDDFIIAKKSISYLTKVSQVL